MFIAKRVKANKAKITKSLYDIKSGIELSKSLANAKFVESLELHVNLGTASKPYQRWHIRALTVNTRHFHLA